MQERNTPSRPPAQELSPASERRTTDTKPKSWRDTQPVHEAADLFPLMSADELRALGEDIKRNGLTAPLVLWRADDQSPALLLDGRNRLDAIELCIGPIVPSLAACARNEVTILDASVDPWTYVISANLRRRHLTDEDRRKAIAGYVAQAPQRSNRQIAKQLGVDHHTVAKARAEGEDVGKVPHVETHTDTKGREQPATKPKRSTLLTATAAHAHADRGHDLYETPEVATRALLAVERLSGTIWEPASGPGSIVRVLRAAGHHVIATDLVNYNCPDALGGVDFLAQTVAPKGAESILTNPPYMFADDFVRHALTLAPRVIMLLRLMFLESEGRSDILDGGQLARVYIFRNRLPMMHRAGWGGPKIDSSAIPFAWFVWDRNHRGPAQLRRISWTQDEALPPPEAVDGSNRAETTEAAPS